MNKNYVEDGFDITVENKGGKKNMNKLEKLSKNHVWVGFEQSEKNKGITLVALVITIIVLIILAGVSINAIMNKGIITNAKDAKNTYENSKQEEQTELGKLLQNVEKDVKGNWTQNEDNLTVTNGNVTLKIGDYVAYKPQTEVTKYEVLSEYSGYSSNQELSQDTTLNWRVLGTNENGKLELISDNTTEEQITLQGYQIYNNGVYLIDNSCNTLYGNTENGTIGRGLKIEDIQNRIDSTYDYGNDYGTNFTVANANYPKILEQERGAKVNGQVGNRYTQSEQDELISQTEEIMSTNIEFNRNYWNALGLVDITGENNCFKNLIYADLLMRNGGFLYGGKFLLSSRFVNGASDTAWFGICSVDGVNINMYSDDEFYFSSEDEGYTCSGKLRPVVTLGNSVKIQNNEANTEEHTTVETAWVVK